MTDKIVTLSGQPFEGQAGGDDSTEGVMKALETAKEWAADNQAETVVIMLRNDSEVLWMSNDSTRGELLWLAECGMFHLRHDLFTEG